MNKILWNSIKSPLRYFWVPAGEDVFAGEYQIENGDGEEASVDLESLIPFEIDGEQAEAIMMSELEDMTNELGGLFKGLFNLGKRMINSELMDEDSEDWDSEEDSDWDSEDDSDEDSDSEEDSDFDDADLDKVISLFDLDSEEDSDEDSDSDEGTLEELLSQFGDDLEGPMSELRDLIVKEVGNLGEELDKLGSQAAKEVDAEPGAGQDILRELGQWLINLADEQEEREEVASEDVVVMEFKPKEDDVENEGESDIEASTTDASTNDSPIESTDEASEEKEDDKESEESSDNTGLRDNTNTEENPSEDIVSETNTDTEQDSPELPSASNLKRMTKAQLIELGGTFGLTLSTKDTKNTLLEQLETLR